MSENIETQLNKGNIGKVGLKNMPNIKPIFFAPPTGESPNPLDSGLANIPGIDILNTFEGIEISGIAAVDGMGNTLKDAIVSIILLDEKRGVKEQEVAASRFGWGRTESEKQERLRLKELQQLLKIEKMKTSQ
jgi:hypothetical protein